jgi:hypothetical protein
MKHQIWFILSIKSIQDTPISMASYEASKSRKFTNLPSRSLGSNSPKKKTLDTNLNVIGKKSVKDYLFFLFVDKFCFN